MVVTAILAGLAAIGALILADQAERQRPTLQPIPVKANRSKNHKTRS